MGLAKILRKGAVAEVHVASGDCRFTDGACRLVTSGLGSEAVLIAQASEIQVSAMLRFVYPDSRVNPTKAKQNPWLFADTGIALLLSTLKKLGAAQSSLQLQAIGAASADAAGVEAPSGKSNELSIRKALWAEGVLLKNADLGGDIIRSVWFDTGSNRLLVRSHKRRSTALDLLWQHRAS